MSEDNQGDPQTSDTTLSRSTSLSGTGSTSGIYSQDIRPASATSHLTVGVPPPPNPAHLDPDHGSGTAEILSISELPSESVGNEAEAAPAAQADPTTDDSTTRPAPTELTAVSSRWFLLLLTFTSGSSCAGLILAWPVLSVLFLTDNLFENLCTDKGLPPLCSEQLFRLNSIFTVGSVTLAFSPVLLGPILDRLGPKYTSVLSIVLPALGTFLFGVANTNLYVLYLFASFFFSLGGFLQVALISIANLFTKVSLAISLITGMIAISAVVVFIWHFILYGLIGLSFSAIAFIHTAYLIVLAILLLIFIPLKPLVPGAVTRWAFRKPWYGIRYYNTPPPFNLDSAVTEPSHRDTEDVELRPIPTGQPTPTPEHASQGPKAARPPKVPTLHITTVSSQSSGEVSGSSEALPESSLSEPVADLPGTPEPSNPTDLTGPPEPPGPATTLSPSPTLARPALTLTGGATISSPDLIRHQLMSSSSGLTVMASHSTILRLARGQLPRRNTISNAPQFVTTKQFVRSRRFWILLLFVTFSNWKLDYYISAIFPRIARLQADGQTGPGANLVLDLAGPLLPLAAAVNLLIGGLVGQLGEVNIIFFWAGYLLVFNVLTLPDNYIVQFVGFLFYLGTRPILFVTFWALANRLCNPKTLGRATAIIFFFVASCSLSNLLINYFAIELNAFFSVNLFFLVLNLIQFPFPFLLRSAVADIPNPETLNLAPAALTLSLPRVTT